MNTQPDHTPLEAQERIPTTRGALRALRHAGHIPGTIYGSGKKATSISVPQTTLLQRQKAPNFMSAPLTLTLNGKSLQVLPREVQRDPLKGHLLHIDFMQLTKGTTVDVEVPVMFLNEDSCIGVKRGGILNVVRHTVELRCPAMSIPDSLEVNLEACDIGDSIKISQITLPKGVQPVITERDFNIATIAAPTTLEEEHPQEESEPSDDQGTQAPQGEDDSST